MIVRRLGRNRGSRSTVVVGGLVCSWVLLGCVGFSEPSDAPVPDAAADRVLAESEVATRPPIDLGDRDPESVFVGEGLTFGEPGATAALATEGLESDPLVDEAIARQAFATDTGEPIATVVSVALSPTGFTSPTAVDGFTRGLAAGLAGSADPPATVEVGPADGFAVTADDRARVTFRVDDLVVLVDSSGLGSASGVAELVAQAMVAGDPPGELTTPLPVVDPTSVFVPLEGFTFEPFPEAEDGEDEADLPFERPEVPLFDGATQLPDARLVVIGNEIRGVAWVIPTSPEAVGSAENLVEPMRALAAARSGGDTTESVIRDVSVLGGDAVESVRVFHVDNLVFVVDGIDPVNADAITAEWLRSIGRR